MRSRGNWSCRGVFLRSTCQNQRAARWAYEKSRRSSTALILNPLAVAVATLSASVANRRGRGRAPATVNRRYSLAKTFFRAAVRRELIPRNPFDELPGRVRSNRQKMRFITPEAIQHVIESCPDGEWRRTAPRRRGEHRA